VLLVYSVHFKSNLGELQIDIAKREEAARQLIAHTAEMERLYSTDAKVVTVTSTLIRPIPGSRRRRPFECCVKSLNGPGKMFPYPSV
jgi:hypothetical protein